MSIDQISIGNMFLDINQQHIASLQVKLKRETSEIRKCREVGLMTVTISKQIPLLFVNRNTENLLNNNNEGNNEGDYSNTLHSVKVSKKITKKLNVVERLNLARKEAILERKLDQLKLESESQAKSQAIQTAQQLLENLPTISKLNSTTITTTPKQIVNLNQSSSLPSFLNDQISKREAILNENPSISLEGRCVVG